MVISARKISLKLSNSSTSLVTKFLATKFLATMFSSLYKLLGIILVWTGLVINTDHSIHLSQYDLRDKEYKPHMVNPEKCEQLVTITAQTPSINTSNYHRVNTILTVRTQPQCSRPGCLL